MLAAAEARSAPNFVVVVTDGQRWDQVAWMATLQAELVARGTTFSNAFVATTLAGPSRASLLTGDYAFRHGVQNDFTTMEDFDDTSTLATWLDAAGYRTGFVGKYFQSYWTASPYIPPGWDDWHAMVRVGYENYELNHNGTIVEYGSDDEDYSTDVLAREAKRFLEDFDGEPFFLVLAPYAPHNPPIAASRHAGVLDGLEPLRLPNFNEEDVSDKPAWIQALPSLQEKGGGLSEEIVDGGRRIQLETLLAVDDALATILQTLAEIGQADDTVLVFTSAHGLTWGEHRWGTSRNGHEESLRVPLLIRLPGQTEPRDEARQVLNVDLAPTIAELAGVTPPAATDGRSLAPLLDQTAQQWRSDFLTEYWNGGSASDVVPTYAGVRGDRWKYLEYDTAENELYDLPLDPYELESVAEDPGQQSQVQLLSARIRQLRAGADPVAIVTESLPEGTVGLPYEALLEASDGVPPYVWELEVGELPDGLVLDPTTGQIAGVPTAETLALLTFRVSDSVGGFAGRDLDLAVTREPLSVTGVEPAELAIGSSAQIVLDGTGFESGATARICPEVGRVVVEQVQHVDSRTLHAELTVPASSSAGVCGVRVVNPDGGFALLPRAVTLTDSAPAPALTSVTPDRLPLGGALRLDFVGTGFAAGATVAVCSADRVTVDFVELVDDTLLHVDVLVAPDGPTGRCPARVRNPDGSVAFLPAAVTVVQDP